MLSISGKTANGAVIVVRLGEAELLFSYTTLVAVYLLNRMHVTSKSFSSTTTRHINDFKKARSPVKTAIKHCNIEAFTGKLLGI